MDTLDFVTRFILVVGVFGSKFAEEGPSPGVATQKLAAPTAVKLAASKLQHRHSCGGIVGSQHRRRFFGSQMSNVCRSKTKF